MPLSPERITIQLSGFTACHGQPAAVVTSTTPLPPLMPNVCDVGEMVNVQPDDCVTAIVRSATVTVPLRCTLTFAATENTAVPLPVPVAPPPPVPRTPTRAADPLTPAELFRAVIRTGWQTRRTGVTQ